MSEASRSTGEQQPPATRHPVPAAATGRRPRPRRADLSTATAAPAERPRPPPLFDPFRDGPAPLQPEDFLSDRRHDGKLLEFKYDEFLSARRVARRNVHGAIETAFDAESIKPTRAYLRKVESRAIEDQIEVDEEVERERLAGVIEQPDEVKAQLRADLRNPRFIDAIGKTVIRSKSAAAAARAHLAPDEPVRIEPVLAGATEPDRNPDFFTHMQTFDGYDAIRASMAKRRRRHDTLVEQDDDAELASDELLGDDATRAVGAPDVGSDDGDGGGGGGGGGGDALYATDLSDAQARALLDVNPFASLRMAARCDLMRVLDVASIYRMLYPLVMRHEEHREHFNLAELVRALAVRGAKYDGCVQVHSARRLGDLLDRRFYGSFYDGGGELCGGHEHYQRQTRGTRFCVLKFYLVQRNAENCGLLQVVDETSRREGHANRAARLNAAGAYDMGEDAKEEEGADIYGSMHDVQSLHREFMLCMRLVCVECAEDPRFGIDDDADDDNAESSDESCASVLDEDFVLPPEFGGELPEAAEADEASERAFGSEQSAYTVDGDQEGSATIAPDRLLSSESSTSHVREVEVAASSSRFGDARSRTSNALVSDKLSDAHAGGWMDDDDDDDDAEPDTELVRGDPDAMPNRFLALSHKQAAQLVGKPRAVAFLQRINGRSVGVLCPRAFMFYAVDPNERV